MLGERGVVLPGEWHHFPSQFEVHVVEGCFFQRCGQFANATTHGLGISARKHPYCTKNGIFLLGLSKGARMKSREVMKENPPGYFT